MVQPINYMLNIKSPFERAIEGYQTGFNIRAAREGQELKQRAAEQALRIQEQKAQRQQAMQRDLGEFISNKAATGTDAGKLMLKYPEMSQNIQRGWEQMGAEQKKQSTAQVMQVTAALESGQTDIAKNMLSEQAIAARNAGDEQRARMIEGLVETVDVNPDVVKNTNLMTLSSVLDPDEFTAFTSKLGEERRKEELQPLQVKKQEAQLRKEAADLGLTEAQTSKVLKDTEKLGVETKKSLIELEAAGGITDPQKRFEVSRKLRQDYNNLSKDYFAIRNSYDRVKASAVDPDAAGDLALIFNFMKMLDPGSVVREGEFANAQNAAGVPDRIRNMYNKVFSGERLNENQRGMFVGRSKKIFDTTEKRNKKDRDYIIRIGKESGIKEREIFGADEEVAGEVTEEGFAIPPTISVKGKTYTAADISDTARLRNMTEQEVVERLQALEVSQ